VKQNPEVFAIYAELAESVLGIDPGRVISGAPKPLGLLT